MTYLLPFTRRLKRPGVGALVLVAFISAACVKQKAPGVAIKNLKADIVFGLNPPAAAPPSITPPVDVFDLGPEINLKTKLPSLPPPPAAPFCRTAQISDAPERQAGLHILGQPEVGKYRWKLNGSVKFGGVDIPIVGQYFTREISDVTAVETQTLPVGGDPANEPIETKIFSYTLKTALTVVGQQSLGTQESRFQVKDDAVTVSLNNNPLPVAGGGIGKNVVVGDPERGITLKSLSVKDTTGKVTAEFNYTPGLLLLPLKVNPGERYQSVAVDTKSGSVVVHDGLVENREFVDACGDLIQGWKVNARQTFIDASGRALVAQYDYMFAPQHGGMLIYEKIGPPDLNSIPIPTPPVIPGSPTPNIPSPPTTLPPLPIDLPSIGTTYEYTVGQLHPTAP